MNKRILLFLLCLLGFHAYTNAQTAACGSDEANNYLKAHDPVFAASLQRQLRTWNSYNQLLNHQPQGLVTNTPNGPVYEIPVVFHIIHTGQAVGTAMNPSDATIQTLVNYLNSVYAATWASNPDTNNGGVYVPIKFKLAARTPACLATTGINRVDGSGVPGYSSFGIRGSGATQGGVESTVKALSVWPNTSYLNIWIVTNIQGAAANGGGIAGYAYYPGAGSAVDGVVLRYDQTNWAIAHEVGHSMGLRHTFEGSSNATTCPTNTNCVTDGDLVCDTDPHALVSGCPTGLNPCTNTSYLPITYNIMNYTSCPNRFSAGQRTRMIYQLLTYRRSLTSSLGLLAPGTYPTSIAPPIAACIPSGIGVTGNAYNIGPGNITLADLDYASEGYTDDGNKFYIDNTANTCLAGQSIAHLNPATAYTLNVTPGAYNPENTSAWIDWNNDGLFAASEQVMNITGTSATTGLVASAVFTPPASAVTCMPLRMRIFSDYYGSATPTSCGNPAYGQVEDFTVIVTAPTATPTVTISGTPTGTICANASVIFTGAISGITSPTYQWKRNGVAVGGNTSTYTSSSWLNGDIVTLEVTGASGCAGATATTISNIITLAVTPVVTPSVTIAANPGTNICTGTSVTFTATATNPGTAPVYQWIRNSVVVATGASYTTNTLTNGTVIRCQLTSNANCATINTASSNDLLMTVGTSVTPTASIVANTGTAICTGTLVTFSAFTSGGGTAPTYQWKKNGVNVGTNSTVYGPVTVTNNDVISFTLTSNAACATASSVNSNSLTMAVGTAVTPSITVAASPGNTICSGTPVIFTATATNGGTAPAYQWKKNGVNVGTGLTYTDATLANGNSVTCVLTSNAACVTTATATSNAVVMAVSPAVTPSVSITANRSTTFCEGTPITFTAAPVNGGTAPAYIWKVNGASVSGATTNTFTSALLNNNDAVSVTMTSSAACATISSVTSNTILMTVNPVVVPSLGLTWNPGGSVCSGTAVIFTATPVNGGSAPAYQWSVNGINTGNTTTTYTSSSLVNGDVVAVRLISNATCASTTPVIQSAAISVITSIAPSVTIMANPDDTICAGSPVVFTAMPINEGTAPLYTWRRNGSQVGGNMPTYTQTMSSQSDLITLEMQSNATCVTRSFAFANVIELYVNPLPNPIITKAGQVLNAGAGFATYQWFLDGIAVTGATADTLRAMQNGSYTVAVTDTKGCSNTAAAFAFSSVSVRTVAGGSNDVAFYPNPTRGNVYFQSATGAVNVQVFTMEGKLVLEQAETNKIDISHLADGIYTLQIRDRKGILLKAAKLTKAAY